MHLLKYFCAFASAYFKLQLTNSITSCFFFVVVRGRVNHDNNKIYNVRGLHVNCGK